MPEPTTAALDWHGAYTRAMLEHSADVITIIDAQGTVLYESPSVERLLGETVEERIGTNVFDAIHPEDRARVHAAFAVRLREPDTPLIMRFRLRHANGSWLTVESTGRSRMDDPEVRGVVISSRDITDRADSARARQRQSMAMLTAMDGMAILDDEGIYLSVNRAHAVMYGFDDPEELSGVSWRTLYTDGELRRIDTEVMPFLMHRKQWRGEATGRRRDGTTFPQELSLSIIPDGGIVCAARDITERKAAEAELRASETRFRTVVEALGEGIVINDLQDRVVYSNSRLAQMTGYSAEEMRERSVLDFCLPEDRARLSGVRELRARGVASAYDLRVARRDGEVIWTSVNGSPFRDEKGRVVGTVAVLTDITERRRAEQERERLMSLLNATLEATADGILVIDNSGGVASYNRQFVDMWRIPAAVLASAADDRLLAVALEQVEDAECFLDKVNHLYENPQTESFDEIVLKDGRTLERHSRPQRVDGLVVGRVWSFRDVTGRVAADAALRRSQQMLAQAQRMGRMGGWELDLVTGDGTWSEECARICGRNPADGPITQDEFAALVHPDDRPGLAASEAAAFETGEQQNREMRLRLPSGEYRYVAASVQVECDDSGAPRRMFGHLQDVTERKLEELELVRARDAAEAANRAKSEFLSSMSHELRTPLNSVIGFSSVLSRNRGGTLNDKDLTYLDRIQANGRHLLRLINDVLDLSKVEAGKMEIERSPVDLGALVAATLEEMAGTTRGGLVHLAAQIPDGLTETDTDAAKLKQVLINLLGNAVKFTEAGRVTVAIVADPATRRPLRVEVRDTGVGIAPDRLEAIFEAFEQEERGSSRRFGGTGLGLTISRSLCELMGFRLDVKSERGVGSTFTIALQPPEEPEGAPAPSAAGFPTAEHDRRVLIIDDEPDARFLLKHHLEELGCETRAAGSGREGLRMAREVRPDLITLDLLLPGMNGWDILRALEADPVLCEIPVVIVSVVAGESRGSVPGAVDLVEKPIRQEELREVLDRHLPPGTGRVRMVNGDDASRERPRWVGVRAASASARP